MKPSAKCRHPFVSVTLAMFHQCLGCLNDVLSQYSNQLTQVDLSLSHAMVIGTELANLTEQSEAMFGGIITVDLLINIINGIYSIFFSVGLAGIYGDDVTAPGAVFGIAFLVLAVFSMYRLYCTHKCGQKLADSFSDIR